MGMSEGMGIMPQVFDVEATFGSLKDLEPGRCGLWPRK